MTQHNMSDLSNKCVLLKGLPFHITQPDVLNVLVSENLHNGVDKVEAHIEKQDDKRWIILYKTEEDATRCFNNGPWKSTVGEESVTAVPDFCSECIIPDAWTVTQTPERSWVMIEPDNYSSFSSGELFAGESMPFQLSESENTDKMMKESMFRNNAAEDEDSLPANYDVSNALATYQNLSDSALFGSGYKSKIQNIPSSSTIDPKAGNVEAYSGKDVSTDTLQGNADVSLTTQVYAVPKGTRSVTVTGTQSPEMKLINTEPPIQTKHIVHQSHANHDPNQMQQNAKAGATEVNEQQRFSQFPYYPGQPVYPPYPQYGMMPMYPGYYGPVPATQPNQQPPFVPFPPGIHPHYSTPRVDTPQNFQGINPMYIPQNFYNPYIYPHYAQPMYPPNFPLISGQMKPPGEMGQAIYHEADGRVYKTPVSRQGEGLNQKQPPITEDDTQEYLVPLSRNPEKAPVKPDEMETNDEDSAKGVVSEDLSGSKPKGRMISSRIDTKEMPQLPKKKDAQKEEPVTDENVYEEIPADMLSLDKEITPASPTQGKDFSYLQTPMKGRELPPVPTGDSKQLSPSTKQVPHTVGDRRSLPLDISLREAKHTEDVNIKSRRSLSCIESEKDHIDEDKRAKRKEEATNKIMVTGFKSSSSLESLGFFFENKRKSGGDEIVKSYSIEDPDAFIIEFRDSSVVESVLKKQEQENFKLDEAVLKVRPYIPPPIDESKVFMSGIRDGASRESLEMFVEVVTGLTPVAMDYGDTPGTVMLSFDEPPDFENFQRTLKKRTFEDRIVSVTKVDVTNSVQVIGYDSSVTHDTFMYYFESKRSGGGEIIHIKTENCRTIVQFRFPEDAHRVCDGRQHVLNERELNVSLYYKCMDLDKNFQIKLPEPFVLHDINKNILKFVQTSAYVDKLDSELKKASGEIDWSAASSAEDELLVKCTLDPKEKESVQLVKTWKQRCTDAVNGVIDALDVNEDIVVQEEIWLKFLEALGDLNVSNPDEVMVVTRKHDLKIVVCGIKQAVNSVSELINRILQETEKKNVEDTKEIKKPVVLKVYQVALLNTLKFFVESNFSAFGVTVEMKGSREVIFCGQKCNIDKIVSTMYEQLKGFAKQSFVASKQFKDMMFEKEARDYIKTNMMKQKVIGVWDVVRGDENVYMYSKSDKQAQVAIDVVNRCLVQKTLPLDLKMEDQIDGDTGKKMITKLLDDNKGLVKVEKQTGQLSIIAVDYLMEKICEEIKQFLDLHVITEEFVDVISGRLAFINQFCREKLDKIETQYRSLSVVIEQQETDYRQGFKVKGQKDGCKLAINQLRKLIEDVSIEEHAIESQDIDVKHFFEITPGRNELIDIEMKEKCVIKLKTDTGKSHHPKYHALRTHAECLMNTCKITVVEGNLTELHDKVDVIVNPRNLKMSNTDGLSGAILQKGGYDIQKESESLLKDNDASYGDVFVGGSWKLRCRSIFHVITPEWRGGLHNEEKLLRITVTNCLDKMQEKKFSSIAMSAIGTGRFRFPRTEAIKTIVGALQTYLNTEGTPVVKEVYLCDLQHDNATDFVKELMKVAKDVTVHHLKDQENPGGSDDDDGSPIYFRRRRTGRRSEGGETDRNIKIVMVKGELARQKVDAIVNSTNTSLDLKVGTLSRSLLKVGGETILQELQQKYPDGITPGKIAVSAGGNLSCKEIYHGVLFKWDKGQGQAEKVMETFIRRCLKLADERGMNSIAFPALGTGVLGFPADRVARLLYETIHDYDRNHPDTGISSVLLVVYQGDDPTLQAFSFIEKKMKSGQLESTYGSRQTYSFAKTFSMAPADLSASHRFNIGPVTVTILQGDITKEKTDIVVNSTIEELNLASGAVSKAILNAAGSSLQTECHTEANRAQMKAQGYIMTSPGNMMCGKLLHIRARARASNWEETVMKCLGLVEADGASSVSFPALGTGGKGCNPESVAKNMFSALKKYIQSSDYKSTLKTIRIVIFQADMVKKFVDASSEESKGSFKFLDKFMNKPKPSKVVICIYAESPFRIKSVKRLLDEIFVEETVYHRKKVIEGLKNRQLDKIKRMAQDKHAFVKVRGGSLKLNGPKCFIKQIKDNITAYLDNIEKDAEMNADKGAIALPKSWGKMGLQDATKVVQLGSSDIDYTNVIVKFQAEAMGTFTRIVKIERIQNPTLYTQYMAKKKQMELANPGRNVEQPLWHGTSSQVVNNINSKGFDRNYNSGASHGVGVYLAVKAATSVQGYCRQDPVTGQRYIYLARVLTGDYCVGQGAIRLPPQKPGGNPHDRYDSTTDNVAAPNFFVIFHDAQAYPEFLITFI